MITDVSNDESESVRNGVPVELFANLSFVVKCKSRCLGIRRLYIWAASFLDLLDK